MAESRLEASTAQGLVGADDEGRITLFSAAAERLLGHRAADALGRDFADVLVPERHRATSRHGLLRAAAGGDPRLVGRTVSVPALTATGEERAMAMTVLEAGAPPTRFIACLSPDTGDLGLEASPLKMVGVFTIHASGRIEMSEACREMHGIGEADGPSTIAEYLARFAHPDDREALRARGQDRAAGRPVPDLNSWRIIAPGRGVRSLLSEGRSVLAEDGTLDRTIGVVRDVTESEGTRRALIAHRTANRALDAWDEPRGGVAGVLREMVTAMGWTSGAMWKPAAGDDASLECQVFWMPEEERDHAPSEATVRETVFGPGEGVPGQAWLRGEVVSRGCDVPDADAPPELAVPVMVDGRPLAVLHFHVAMDQFLSDELREALTEIGRGRLAEFFGRHRSDLGLSPLTDREQQVLQMAADGGAISAIAERLGISSSTVKTHFEHIYDKLAVSDRGGAVAEGFRQGLVT